VLILRLPADAASSPRTLELGPQLGNWTAGDGTGIAFDASAGFILPNGALRSPAAAWLRRERWDALAAEQRQTFVPLCPDFVVELRSPSDRLPPLQRRLRELINNGAQLGWLIDPLRRAVHVYRPGAPPKLLLAPRELSADPVLPGFRLDLGPLL